MVYIGSFFVIFPKPYSIHLGGIIELWVSGSEFRFRACGVESRIEFLVYCSEYRAQSLGLGA